MTVIDTDAINNEMEIIVGTSAGTVYVFDYRGDVMNGWPVNINTIHGQVSDDICYEVEII